MLEKLKKLNKNILKNFKNKRLKKDMIVKVSQVAAEFRRVSNKQMADTTKRTIKENVSINNQLHKVSKKVMDLVDENSKEKEKVRMLFLLS